MRIYKKYSRVIRIADPELRLLMDAAFRNLLNYGYDVRLTKESSADFLKFKALDKIDLMFLHSDLREAFKQALK